ncbi:MAG: OmpA family protein [Deltaproteobacteria bacterium]|nr:OmpA family protein [Deltaproteobacteria bacterium]MBP7289737.1 OmpA family protein [Nannocystaceae bacterium]
MKRIHIIAMAVALAACSRLPKPAEMTEFENERKTREGEELKLELPELVKRADDEHARAVEAHDDKEEDLLKHHAHLAWLWWESASLRHESIELTAATELVNAETAKLEDDLAEAKKRQKLAKATLDRMQQIIALEGKVSDSQEVGAAKSAIGEALSALKDAQAVDADVHASVNFAAAEAKLKAATDALGKNRAKDAQSFAIEAKAAAEAAKREAEPKYTSTEADQAKMARQKALFEKVGEITGVSRSMVEGGVQITVVEAFSASGGVDMQPVMEATFNRLAEVAKEFSDYAMVIEGHTDSKGNKSKNLQLSDARAKSVMAFLAAQGVAPDRMTAFGKGSAEPVADNKTKDGRAKNRRIEILFVPSSK